MNSIVSQTDARSTQLRAGEAQLKAEMLAGLEGEASAHARLLRTITPLLRAFFARRMRDAAGDVEDLVQQFERHVPAGRVLVLPWDKHIAAGTEIQLDLLGKTFRRRTVELAAPAQNSARISMIPVKNIATEAPITSARGGSKL